MPAGSRLVYYPSGADLKADNLATFFNSLPEKKKELFVRGFHRELVLFFAKYIRREHLKKEVTVPDGQEA